jgi:hypothetical protein
MGVMSTKKVNLIDLLSGGRRGIRTPNILIWNQTLYRWSYTPLKKQKKGPTKRNSWLALSIIF